MKTLLTNILLLTALSLSAQKIGQWNAYMAYGDITDIEPAGNMVYVLSSNDLFSYNVNDMSISTYNKMNVLNDTEISHIAWCNSAKRLVIIYSNQNIDLLDNSGNVTNINDYYNKSMTEDKTINNITIDGNHAYLSTGFGILKVNIKDAEISNTYNLSMNITDCAISNNMIYAQTASGTYAGNTSDNLLDKNNWHITYDPISFNDANDIAISYDNGYMEHTAYDSNNKCYWSNQSDGKLQGYKIEDGNKTIIAENINPDGPKYNTFGFIKLVGDKLYTVNGVGEKAACIQVKDNDEWTIYDNKFAENLGHAYIGHYCIDVDPTDPGHVIVGGQTGLYEFKDGKNINSFTNDNSPLKTASTVGNNDKNYVMVTGVMFDNEGNLWCLNSVSPSTSIFEYTKDKKWISHHKKELMVYDDRSFEDMRNMIAGSNNLTWFVNNFYRKPALVCYQASTDAIVVYDNFINEDGTTLTINSGVRCAAEDKDRNIWVGTNVGPIVLEAENIGKSPYEVTFNQIKVPRNDGTNYADYLLSGVDITAIAIDGGNRKWFGTNGNGMYLISEDNMEQIHHFTTENSPLLSNNIMSVAINNDTGEIFFGTDKGLCSYMNDATTPNESMDKDNVYAYPNPVEPGYSGLITVTGLSHNADVKIVTVNGTLVAEGRSSGGTFTWDGNDLKGKRVASGIYMVQTATADGSKGTVCKIAVVN